MSEKKQSASPASRRGRRFGGESGSGAAGIAGSLPRRIGSISASLRPQLDLRRYGAMLATH